MSQRNPMNERYQSDKRQGTTRKSAASAKPKSKAAASVTYSAPKKDPKAKKAELKAQRKAETDRQREIDRKYSTPDTARYPKLRRIFWAAMVGAIACVAASWMLRAVQPEWLAMAALICGYVLIIFAFYIDLSKVRKERRAYQTRMLAKEVEERVYVEKKPGFDVEAQQLFAELRDILGVDDLTGVRVIRRYDVEGISDELFAGAVAGVFGEPAVDEVFYELPQAGDAALFAVEYLPGQFDQRAESASECIQLISQGERPAVRSANVYVLEGALDEARVAAVKNYVINPVEAREADLAEAGTLPGLRRSLPSAGLRWIWPTSSSASATSPRRDGLPPSPRSR